MAGARSFFVSYARKNAAYTRRLTDHLRRAGLPVWIDADMDWGVRFPQEIAQRVRDALAVIVVMSPAAEESDWVQREILEGQRHSRAFLPILVEGTSLFLLASSNFFDARGGQLPGEREINLLKRIHRDDPAAPGGPDPAPADGPSERPDTPRSTEPPIGRLQDLLGAGQYEYADIFTTSLLLDAVGRLADGWLRSGDGERLPHDLLARIDAGWSAASKGVHGFSAQLARHSRPPLGAPAGRTADFTALARALGWKAGDGRATPRYDEFSPRGEHHVGFFPTFRNPQMERHLDWHDYWAATAMAVHLRLRERSE